MAIAASANPVHSSPAYSPETGYVYVGTNPYVTVSADDGSYTITDVPPGDYKVTVWHEKLGKVSKDVTVVAGAAAKLDHTFSK